MDYKDYNDNELLLYISEANEEANDIMFRKYDPLIQKIAKKLHKYCQNTGLEMSDLVQEGRLGLNTAILKFKDERETSFYTFSKTCIERRMVSLIVASTRQKHRALNEALSFENNETDNEFNLENVIGDNSYNPEYLYLDNERESEIIENVRNVLTDFENQVFDLKKNGFNYKEIAEILDKTPKAIDNAIQRIRVKIKEQISK